MSAVASVLLLHGFTGSPDSWRRVCEQLPRDVEVQAPLLTGHGATPAALHVRSFEAEVERLRALAAPGALLVGYSLGARLALALAAREPQRFRGALLISGSPGLRDENERGPRRRRDAELCALLTSQGLSAFVERWEREPLFASQAKLPPSVREEERRRRLGHSAPGLCHSLRVTGLAEMPSYWPRLQQLTLPLELLVGELDPRFCEIASAVVKELPAARLTRVADAGHNVVLERPEAVSEAMLRGLGR